MLLISLKKSNFTDYFLFVNVIIILFLKTCLILITQQHPVFKTDYTKIVNTKYRVNTLYIQEEYL